MDIEQLSPTEQFHRSLRCMVDLYRFAGRGIEYSLEAFILECGRDFTGARLPPRMRRGERGYCFANAARIARRRPDLLYAEGYGFRIGLDIPVHHAWLVDRTGAVIDPTWDRPEECLYRGIALGFSVLKVARRQTGCASALQAATGLNRVLAAWVRTGQVSTEPRIIAANTGERK